MTAVSPIVAGAAVSGPAGILMESQGLPVSIAGVAQAYQDFLDLLVVDSRDSQLAESLRQSGRRVHCTNTVMRSSLDKANLATSVLEALKQQSAHSAMDKP